MSGSVGELRLARVADPFPLPSETTMPRMSFKPAPPPRGRAVSVYLPAEALKLVQPWIAGRARSARIGAILGRYADAAVRRPQLTVEEAGILVQLLPPLAGMRDINALALPHFPCWAEG